MKLIAYALPGDSRLHIDIPVRGRGEESVKDSKIEARAMALLKERHPGVEARFVKAIDVPSDRTFRDAWTTKGAKVAVCMDRARDVHMSRLRGARNEKLKQLDAEQMRALGTGEGLERIEARKQALRDMPRDTDLSAAATPEALAATVPSVLTEG